MMGKLGFPRSLLVFLFLSAGCSRGMVSETANYPITSLYTAVERAMSMGVLNYSENHRTLKSRPFLIKQDDDAKKQGLHERGFAEVTILGEQRPYTIEVVVTVERAKRKGPKAELMNDDYEYERHDQRLAKKLLNSILTILDKRERDKNIIDDFRPF